MKEYEQTEPDDIMANSKTVLEKLNRTNRKELLNYCKLVGGDDAKNLVDAFVVNNEIIVYYNHFFKNFKFRLFFASLILINLDLILWVNNQLKII